MSFHLHTPSAPLCQYVHDIFYYEAGIAPYEAEKLLPDNTIYLLMNFTDKPKKLFDDISLSSYKTYKKAWVSGMQRKYIVIEATNNNRMMVVRFKPGMAFPFFKTPLNNFSGMVLESDDICGGEIAALRERLWNIADVAEKCRVMESYLLTKLNKENDIHPAVRFMVTALAENPNLDIRSVVSETGYSHKHILHLFEKYVGISPKHFARVNKFQQVLKAIDQQKLFGWTSLAGEYGFYDQAHFINDFKYFSGINPTAYMVEKTETFNYLPVEYTKAR